MALNDSVNDSPLRDRPSNGTPSGDAPPMDQMMGQTMGQNGQGSSAPNPELSSANAAFSQDTSSAQAISRTTISSGSSSLPQARPSSGLLIIIALVIMGLGLLLNNDWIGVVGAGVALVLSMRALLLLAAPLIEDIISPQQRSLTIALLGMLGAIAGFFAITGLLDEFLRWIGSLNWDAVGALGEVFGAIGQILIAILAVYVAWRQYVISKDLTIQQNTITQQQTIDSYFQGISELVLDAEGLLEDWPQERAIAEGRTAAILGSVDAGGKAKIIRFLSRSRLLTPLKRDRHLGRAMLDGMGGYQEDRDYGIRVIDLGVMLAAANLMNTDLRWTDLSDANLVRANMRNCDLVKANLARTVLYEADLQNADLMGVRLFYGSIKTASPRTRADIPNYETGEFTGAVIENANLLGVQRLSDDQRYYCCAWGGSKTRSTIPGGCDGIPNKLGR